MAEVPTQWDWPRPIIAISFKSAPPSEFWNGEIWVEWNPPLRSEEIIQSPDGYEVFKQALFSESHPVSTHILVSNFRGFIKKLTENQLEESLTHLSLCMSKNTSSFSREDCVYLIQKILDNGINLSKETELVVLGHLIGLTKSKKWKIPVSKLLSHFSVDLVGPFLVEKLGDETDEVAVKTLMRSIGKLGFRGAESTVSMFLNSENPILRRNAIQTLTVLQSRGYHIEISKCLDDDLVFVQKEAINSLRELKIPSSVSELKKYKSKTKANRKEINLALASFGDIEALDSLEIWVKENNVPESEKEFYWDIFFSSKGEKSIHLIPSIFGRELQIHELKKISQQIRDNLDEDSVSELKKYKSKTKANRKVIDLALASFGDIEALDGLEIWVKETNVPEGEKKFYWDFFFSLKGEKSIDLIPYIYRKKLTWWEIAKISEQIRHNLDEDYWITCLTKLKQFSISARRFTLIVKKVFPELEEPL